MFCSQIFTLKLNLWSKVALTYAISIVKWFLGIFVLENIFYFIWIIDVLQQYCENYSKTEQVELVKNLAPSYLPYRLLHDLASFLLQEKVKIFDFVKTNAKNNPFCTEVVKTNGFALPVNHDKILQIYFCVKRQAKINFLKDVESTVDWTPQNVLGQHRLHLFKQFKDTSTLFQYQWS